MMLTEGHTEGGNSKESADAPTASTSGTDIILSKSKGFIKYCLKISVFVKKLLYFVWQN